MGLATTCHRKRKFLTYLSGHRTEGQRIFGRRAKGTAEPCLTSLWWELPSGHPKSEKSFRSVNEQRWFSPCAVPPEEER